MNWENRFTSLYVEDPCYKIKQYYRIPDGISASMGKEKSSSLMFIKGFVM